MWEQIKKFDIKKMGTKKGYCLQNVRLGFGIPAKYASAKLDMEANKKAGTLHNMSTIPHNVAVPVYMDTASKYEHIIVCDRGTYYSDGKRLTSTKGLKFFGWGEMCDGVKVVKYIDIKYYEPCLKKYASISEALKSIGADGSYAHRKKIAIKNGITNYTGTAKQNITILNKLKQGKLIKV